MVLSTLQLILLELVRKRLQKRMRCQLLVDGHRFCKLLLRVDTYVHLRYAFEPVACISWNLEFLLTFSGPGLMQIVDECMLQRISRYNPHSQELHRGPELSGSWSFMMDEFCTITQLFNLGRIIPVNTPYPLRSRVLSRS